MSGITAITFSDFLLTFHKIQHTRLFYFLKCLKRGQNYFQHKIFYRPKSKITQQMLRLVAFLTEITMSFNTRDNTDHTRVVPAENATSDTDVRMGAMESDKLVGRTACVCLARMVDQLQCDSLMTPQHTRVSARSTDSRQFLGYRLPVYSSTRSTPTLSNAASSPLMFARVLPVLFLFTVFNCFLNLFVCLVDVFACMTVCVCTELYVLLPLWRNKT